MTAAVTIRRYVGDDQPAIREINRQAFDMSAPGTFEKLLGTLPDVAAWVAAGAEGRILGHIILTPATVEAAGRTVQGMGLGELAVLPDLQRQGIGTQLGTAAIAALRAAGCPFVIVVGHAKYYPRFGFRPGSQLGLRCQWEKVPDANFMALILDEALMRDAAGVARFRDVA